MSVEADLRTYLLTLGTVSALVGGTGNDARIRPDVLDEDDDDTLQCIIIEVDDERILNTLAGTGGRRYAAITLRCRARTKAGARAVAAAVRTNGTDPGTGLAGYKGTINGTAYDAVLVDEQSSPTPVAEGSSQNYYYVFSNYTVTWPEAV